MHIYGGSTLPAEGMKALGGELVGQKGSQCS